MPKFLLKISEDPIEFEAPNAEAFLEAWKGVFPWEYDNDNTFMRMAAGLHATGVASLSGLIVLRHSLPT